MSNKGLQAQAKVLMSDGTKKPIGEIQIGDIVVGLTGLNSVVEVNEINLNGKSIYGFNNNDPFLFEGQPVYSKDIGWAAFKPQTTFELEPDAYDDIVDEQGVLYKINESSVEGLTEAIVDGNDIGFVIVLDGDHTYFLEDMLVHNGGGRKKKPRPPAPQPVITAGRISGPPTVYSVGSTTLVSNAPDYGMSFPISTTPFIPVQAPFWQPAITSPVPAPQVGISAKLASAEQSRDIFCDDILSNTGFLSKSQTIRGNGSATRFRFEERGVPTSVRVINLSTGNDIDTNTYTITPRGDSFAWITFDTAPASGVFYTMQFQVGSSDTNKRSTASEWTNWTNHLVNLERDLSVAKNNIVERSSNVQLRPGSWSVSDITQIDDAINAARELRADIGNVGSRVNTAVVRARCDYLNAQIAKIQNDLQFGPVFGTPTPTPLPIPNPPLCPAIFPPLPGCGAAVYPVVQVITPVVHVDVRIRDRIYDNTMQWIYFRRGTGGFYFYLPPNARPNPFRRWKRFFDESTNRYYYEPCSGNG